MILQRLITRSFDQPIIVGMGADPKPEIIPVLLRGQSAIAATNTDRPEILDFLEVQRGVIGVVR